ncbi:protein kinase [candidate division WOR-3 bacterium]|nr:protein kinase [candidate division WOR-3 bacterium]
MIIYDSIHHTIDLRGAKNYIQFKSKDYELRKLWDRKDRKGGNSFVFDLIDPNEENSEINQVIKICKFYINPGGTNKRIERIERFKREIKALKIAKSKKCQNVIEYFDDAEIKIKDKNGTPYSFLCYIMEKAENDLCEYILENYSEIDAQEKFNYCVDILNAIKELHLLGIYHRDIKPDNVFRIGKTPKIGDLGLISFRDEDSNIDKEHERIGSFGWISPEVMNKTLTEGIDYFQYDCRIDEKSDIFQLGKLFWFIFKGNVPIGQITKGDFSDNLLGSPLPCNKDIFGIINEMIQYSKDRRIDLDYIKELFKSLYKDFGM